MKQLAPFDDYKAKAEKLKKTAETLTVTDINDKAGMKLARATRLELKDVRVAIEKRRKELGEHHLRETQRINGDAKALKDLIEPLETRLLEQEQFAEREAARLLTELREIRTAELAPFLTGPLAVDVGAMPEAEYTSLFNDCKAAYEAKIEREAREKAEAEAAAKAERERIEAQRIENERLKKEAAEREAAAAKEREAAAALLAKERAEAAEREAAAAAKAKAEREELQRKADEEARIVRERAAEAQRIADENARAQAAKAAAERKAREKIEAEVAAKKAEDDRLAAEKAAAEKAAANAPKKDKLIKFAMDVRRLSLPLLAEVSDVKDFAEGVERFAAWVEKKAATL